MFHPGMAPPKGTKIDRAVVRRAWNLGRRFRGQMLLYMLAVALQAALGVVPAALFKKIIDDAIPTGDLARVGRLSLWVGAVAIVTALAGIVLRYSSAVVGEGVIAELRKALYNHIQRLPIAFFTRTQTGALMSRVNNDVVGAQSAYTFILRTVLFDLLLVIFTLGYMVTLSWKITIASLVAVPLLVWLSKKAGNLSQKVAREQMNKNAAMNSVMTERFNVAGALLVKLFGRPVEEAKSFGAAADDVARVGVRRTMVGIPMMIAMSLVSSLGVLLVYYWGAREVIKGTMPLGTVIALATLVQRLYQPLTELASARVEFVTAFVSFERVFEVLDAPVMVVEKPDAVELPSSSSAGGTGLRVEARGLSFRYPAPDQVSVPSLETGAPTSPSDPSGWVLRELDFVIEPGTMTAIVGPSGAGKSTLAQLVTRLYDVTDGAVLLDGIDVRDLREQSLRDAIGVVSQDAHLFHDTIAANLRYAKPEASDDELEEAAKAAQIHDLLSSLPDGYSTTVGERGYRLSGGEKQRVALARVLLKNPRLVILDEATAHLDSETESLIQEALHHALMGRSSLVIAHRLSTIQTADQILVIDDGRIVERGRHDELVARDGLYRDLYETQFLRSGESGSGSDDVGAVSNGTGPLETVAGT
jgi:ATP-binding cassette, subfamily B, bacterial